MPGPRRSLSTRLVLALVGMSVGSVVLAGLITVVAARPATRSAAISELKTGLGVLAEDIGAGELPRLAVAQLKARLLADQVGVTAVLPDGSLAQPGQAAPRLGAAGRLLQRFRNRQGATVLLTKLPTGVGRLDPVALAEGKVQSGSRGAIVWVAQPLTPTADGMLVVVATRRIGFFALGRLGRILFVAALVAAAVATAVSLWLVRRLTRPLQAIERTARAIAGGDLDARVGAGADVDDELAAVGAAIDSMAAELSRHRTLERAFLMSISHDLRTPLTSIRGYAEAVAEGSADDGPLMDEAARRRAATIIVAESRRLERLVADLLELARLDAREFSLHVGPVDVAEAVRHAALAHEPAAREVGVQLVVTGEPGPVVALADPERLAQVVANLVENALKYAATTVEVATRSPAPAEVEISVADDGPGIDPEDLPRVFERLYTSRRQPGRKVGTGLGLAIVRELVSAMGGRVSVDRTPDGGTRFVVSLSNAGAASSDPPGGSTSWRTTSDGSSSSSSTTPSPSASSYWSSTPPAGGSSPSSSTSTPGPDSPGS
ncbi:MAG: two-component system, OmpR family, sensor kinase [Actinomycetota bacterium]|nr:two-component system, OmpR family, sensor kinase [Actinomycetota bacterium]